MPPLRNKVHVEIAKQQLIRHSLLARGAVGPHACYAAEASWLVTAPARESLRLCRARPPPTESRSEEHTSELQSLMRISYAVSRLKTKNTNTHIKYHHPHKQT